MKKFFLLLTAALAAMSLYAAPVDQATATKVAARYLANEMYAGKMMAPSATRPVLLKAEMGDTKLNQPVYYIFNTSTTFLVVAGDDRAESILMVGDAPLKDINNLAPAMKAVLGQYKEEIMFLQQRPNLQVMKPSQNTAPKLRAVTYGPLLTAKWDQTAPYWKECVFTYNNKSYQCLTGCPATSASMVLYYWKYPTTQVPAVASYTASLELSYYNSVSSFTYPSVSATTFDWANMKDSYSSYTTAQGNAVATLMRYVGQLEKMMYGTESAGGSGIYSNNSQIIATMFKTLGYDSSTRLVNKSSYSESNWGALIQAEMAAGRPVVYLGIDTQGGGHAFNVDGYRDSDGKYHVNFGWSGDGNSWYSMNSFTYSGYTFSSSQQAIIGIQPPGGVVTQPTLTVNPTSLTFTGNTGSTYTKTFTVTGSDLQGNVTISKSGSGVYSVSPTTLTAAQVASGATVTVTYAPTTAGTQTGTITVSSTNAQSQTVSLSGTSTTVPTITVEPTSLSMSTTVGTPATQTFVVSGKNLSDNIIVDLQGTDYDYFAVDKMSISRSAASSGVTVTVTYDPYDAGSHTASVVLTSTGAETKTIALTGTAQEPERTITVDPSSLSFETVAGQAVSKTFRLTGTNLTGALTLTLNDNRGYYSLSQTSVTASRAANGVNITVTYNPALAGTHNASVTISGGGAASKTVTLTGTAAGPTITATPTALTFAATTGETVTKTFTVTGANLSGNLALALNDANGVYSISPATITAANAASGVPVTVTYAPTAFGNHDATVTISGGGADPVTVNLSGVATLAKFTPVMLAAVEDYINLTTFRADWTDATPEANVASYTLEVSTKAEPEPEPELIGSIVGTSFTGSSTGYYDITLPSPWGGTNVRGGLNSVIYFRNNYQGTGTPGSLTYTIPAGYENATFTMKITTATTNDGAGNLAVATPQTAAVNHTFAKGETFAWLVTASSGDMITITTSDTNYSPDISKVEVYSGNATVATLKANEQGDATWRLITGITDKFYTVQDLAAEGTYLYKVKAIYQDGTESDWSNIEEVTLFQNGHGYQLGDVDHNGMVGIADVTALTDYVLSRSEICLICGDVDQNGIVDISDVTALIDMVLNGTTATFNMSRPLNPMK